MNDRSDVLEIEGLSVSYEPSTPVLQEVALALRPGERIGIVGESGSGKTTLGLSIMGLLPANAALSGSVRFGGRELTKLKQEALRSVRGRHIGLVYQDAAAALDPVKTVGRQVEEAIRAHARSAGKSALRGRIGEALEAVGLPASRADAYPHELSGGMRQRVCIAMAIVHRPEIVIADEPTSALDVTTQAQVLDLLSTLVEEVGAALVLITHDLSIVSEYCDRTAVLYAGRVVELGSTQALFGSPAHPYTEGLMLCVEGLAHRERDRLPTIPSEAGPIAGPAAECAFYRRCTNPRRDKRCVAIRPELAPAGPDRRSTAACHYPIGHAA